MASLHLWYYGVLADAHGPLYSGVFPAVASIRDVAGVPDIAVVPSVSGVLLLLAWTIEPQLSDWSFFFFRSEYVHLLCTNKNYCIFCTYNWHGKRSFVCWNVLREELYQGSRCSVLVYTVYLTLHLRENNPKFWHKCVFCKYCRQLLNDHRRSKQRPNSWT